MLNQSELLDRMFQALTDQTRRAIVERLGRGPASVSELARPFQMSLPAVVQHLAVLEGAGLVSSEKLGRVRTCQLVPDGLVPATAWIVEQQPRAARRLDRLGAYLSTHQTDQPTDDPDRDGDTR